MDLMARADANSGSESVRQGFELDMAALTQWMKQNVSGFSGPLKIEQFKGGQSNPTYKLLTQSTAYVLRSKPPGPLLASAHAIDREYRVMAALGSTGVPVPRVYALCEDEDVIGRHFYIMAFTPGPIVWDLPTDRWTAHDRSNIWLAGVEAAATLHAVDWQAIGLGAFGKQGGYVARQFKRWSEQYVTHTRDGIENPALDRLVEWLPDRLPSDEPTSIVHGDLQLSNMIQRSDLKGVAAIIDWELATLGNPISDFAYYCRDYHVEADAGGFGRNSAALGLPSEAEMIAHWSGITGHSIGADWHVYIIFNMFRLAAIRQGVAKRIQSGTATSSTASVAAQGAVTMANTAWRLAQSVS